METYCQFDQIYDLALRPLQAHRVPLITFSYLWFAEYRTILYEIQEKYNFGFKDFIKGNKIFERALAANRLEELLEKR